LFDKIVYESLAYMGPASGFADAFHALLAADRDADPLPATDPDAGVFGAGRCAILAAGAARGFGYALEALGAAAGKPCGLDLAALGAESRALIAATNDTSPKGGHSVSLTVFGKKCSTVALDDPARGALALLFLLCLPVLIGLVSPLFPGVTRG